jgi:hypothetical protein
MKNRILLLLPLFTCMVLVTNAQLFKKLKEKAKDAIAPKKADTETNNTAGTTSNNTDEAVPTEKTKGKKWEPTPNAVKLFTLEKGETFLYDETKVTAVSGKLIYSFVLVNSKYQYFLIEDGKRSGPYKEAPLQAMQIKSEKKTEDEDGSDNDGDNDKIEIGGDKKDPVAMQYSKTISNKLYIVFNGKNFGPYDYVAKMKVSADKKKFWATVVIGGQSEMMSKMGMGNSFLVNEAGVKQTGGDGASIPVKMMVSNSFTAAAVSVMDSKDQKAITISSANKKQESNLADLYAGNKTMLLVADNGDIISIPSQSPTQLLVNGTEAAAFKVPVTNMQRLFIVPDYKKSVFYQKGKLYRGDGSEEALSGVTFLKIVTVNNETAIYYYKIHVTDAGDKDVYVCKKVI